MLLKLESESGIRDPNPDCKKSALESGIRIRRFFGRIAIPDFLRRLPSSTTSTNLQPTTPSTSPPTSGQLCRCPATQRLPAGSTNGAQNVNGSSCRSTSAAPIGLNASDTANRSAVLGGYHSPSYLAYTGTFIFPTEKSRS